MAVAAPNAPVMAATLRRSQSSFAILGAPRRLCAPRLAGHGL